MGVWLFYVQHQFEHTVWDDNEHWNLHEVALHGSSYYVLPGVLRWFTANIGIHHVHHLCSRIPYYRLPRVLREHPELGAIGRLTLWESIKCVRLVLWDESRKKLISFREMRQLSAASAGAIPLSPMLRAGRVPPRQRLWLAGANYNSSHRSFRMPSTKVLPLVNAWLQTPLVTASYVRRRSMATNGQIALKSRPFVPHA